MKNLKITWKQIFFITLGITLFNSVLDATSIFGIGSLFMTFVFFCGWFNYIIYRLTSKDATTKEKIIAEVYFTIIFIAGLLFLSTIAFKYSLGDIVTNVIMFIMSPYKGIRFLLRPLSGWIILSLAIDFFMILIIRMMTKNDKIVRDDSIEEVIIEDNDKEDDNKDKNRT